MMLTNGNYDDEIESIRHHNVWKLIPQSEVPAGRCILGCCTVFLQKRDENNNVSHHKTRIVAKGFSQIEGIDYKETFTPVAHLESVRAVLSLAASMDWEINQFDVKTAFLHGELTEDIYMEQPEGQNEKGKEAWVCKLQKSSYGLKQAGRCWYTRLYDEMHKAGFTRASVDHSIFVKNDKYGSAMVTVHVDDMAAAADNVTTLQHTLKMLQMIINWLTWDQSNGSLECMFPEIARHGRYPYPRMLTLTLS